MKPTIYVNDGPALEGSFSEHREVIDERREPVRRAGMEVALPVDELPARIPPRQVRRHDPPCEGYERTTYLCRICRQVIEPGTRPGPYAEKDPWPDVVARHGRGRSAGWRAGDGEG